MLTLIESFSFRCRRTSITDLFLSLPSSLILGMYIRPVTSPAWSYITITVWQRCRRGMGCSELWKNTIFPKHPVREYQTFLDHESWEKVNTVKKRPFCEKRNLILPFIIISIRFSLEEMYFFQQTKNIIIELNDFYYVQWYYIQAFPYFLPGRYILRFRILIIGQGLWEAL